MSKHNPNKAKLKKEMRLLPGYILCILWVVFTLVLVGWVVPASLSTSREITSGKLWKVLCGDVEGGNLREGIR